MNRGELKPLAGQYRHRPVGERVCLVELERVVGLGLDVDADDVEARLVVAHRCAAGAAEEVEEAWHAMRSHVPPPHCGQVYVGGSLLSSVWQASNVKAQHGITTQRTPSS